MAGDLPDIERGDFESRLCALLERPITARVHDRLFAHYQELRRWNPRISLVGPGAGVEIIERHYAESLVGLDLIDSGVHHLVDVGSGAGFPALVLAAARPDLEVTLVEANQRKWSFLMNACRKMSLPCNCLNARVGPTPVEGLPPRIDVVTSRAVSESDISLSTLLPRLSSRGSVLLWVGESMPETPKSFRVKREVPLSGSRARRILQICRR